MNRRMRSSGRRWPGRLLWVLATVAGLLGGGAGPAEAGWTSIGLNGKSFIVSALALDPTTPTTVYAGTSQGVFKTTDGGTSWSPVNTGLTCGPYGCYATALALDPTSPTTVYAGTASSGIF